ncbi:MAG TPA: hypothetical protein VH044_13730 [Polyangiaceae bacterium]|jgi:hypothetical protein|nr:hypothetical protein [Polyangiaceae bacterium]
MTTSAAQVLQALLANPRDLANVKGVTSPDVTYVSLSENNLELKRYLPWTGTNRGPESIVRAFEGIGGAWETKAFEVRRRGPLPNGFCGRASTGNLREHLA